MSRPDAPPGEEGAPAHKPQRLRLLFPIALTGALLWWIGRSMDFGAVRGTLAQAPLGPLALVVVAYFLVFFCVEMFSLGLGYRWFLTSRVPWRHVAIMRGGMCLLQVAAAPLAEVIPPTYFWRRWRVRVLHTLGSEAFVLFCDNYTNICMLTAGLILAGGAIHQGWWYYAGLWWVLLPLCWGYWLTPVRDRLFPALQHKGPLIGFARARLRHYFMLFGIRSCLAAANLGLGWSLLAAFGVHLKIHHLLLLVPIMMTSTFLPVSAGGYGGPQGAALIVLVQWFGQTTPEVAIAFSLLWSTAFAVGRIGLGVAFAVPLWMLMQERPVLGTRPLLEEELQALPEFSR